MSEVEKSSQDATLPRALFLFIVAKLVVICYAYLVWKTAHALGSFPEAWNRWDAPHYLTIATEGYRARPLFLVFFPLYPFLIRCLVWTGVTPALLALLLSNVASLGAAYFLYRLTAHDYGDEIALRAVWYLAIFPTAYFLCAGYTESLFLLTALACVYAARLRRWWLAGVLGCLATATRLVGLAVVPALLLEAMQQHRQEPGSVSIRRVMGASGVAVFGFVVHLLINYAVTGSWFWFLIPLKDHWSKAFRWPWRGFYESTTIAHLLHPDPEFLGAWTGLLLMPWVVARLRYAASAFYIVSFLMFTSSSFWLSLPRYTLSQFPLFILFARWGSRRWVDRGLTMISIWWLGVYLSRFIQGDWAF